MFADGEDGIASVVKMVVHVVRSIRKVERAEPRILGPRCQIRESDNPLESSKSGQRRWRGIFASTIYSSEAEIFGTKRVRGPGPSLNRWCLNQSLAIVVVRAAVSSMSTSTSKLEVEVEAEAEVETGKREMRHFVN